MRFEKGETHERTLSRHRRDVRDAVHLLCPEIRGAVDLDGAVMINLTAHRGPYRLIVMRPIAHKPGFGKVEHLKGDVDTDDVVSEAFALLTDPRDTIEHVAVWSVCEGAYIGVLRKSDVMHEDR